MASQAPFRASILLLGDSITEYSTELGGWAARLMNAYRRKADVCVRGFAGYTSRHALALVREPGALSVPASPSITTLFFGANDAAAATPFRFGGDVDKPPQHVPLVEYEANIGALAHHARAASARGGLVLLLTPPPVESDKWPDRGNASVRLYTAAAARVAEAAARDPTAGAGADAEAGSVGMGVSVVHIDLYRAFAGADDAAAESASAPWRALLDDGLHLSPAGSALVFDEIMRAVAERAPHLLPDALPLDLPLWRDALVGGPGGVAAASPFAAPALQALRARPFAIPPRPALPPGLEAQQLQREAAAKDGPGAR